MAVGFRGADFQRGGGRGREVGGFVEVAFGALRKEGWGWGGVGEGRGEGRGFVGFHRWVCCE